MNVHTPVLFDECTEFLDPRPGRVLFDGTLGGGGHTLELLNRGATVHASDLDLSAIQKFEGELDENLRTNFTSLHMSFSDAIESFPDGHFDGIMADLGFSSNQLDSSGRGFSYQQDDEVLDLRYDDQSGAPAWKLLDRIKTEKELGKILFDYSGEAFASRISSRIIRMKQNNETPYTVAMVKEAIIDAIPKKFANKTNKVLSRTWQSLRIWTNNEFEELKKFIHIAPEKLKTGGKLGIICFHSLEDKMVTKYFRELALPTSEDAYGNRTYAYKLVSKKAIKPTEEEIERNIRSRSATLRIIEKL